MAIQVTTQVPTVTQLTSLLATSGLHRRQEPERLAKMLANADAMITAWDGDALVGMVRALTDHADVLYVSDLAVAQAYWRQGIGRQLLAGLAQVVEPDLNWVLLASPLAKDYYQHVGFTPHPRGFIKLAKTD